MCVLQKGGSMCHPASGDAGIGYRNFGSGWLGPCDQPWPPVGCQPGMYVESGHHSHTE